MNPDKYTVFGIEKPFPWIGLGLFAAAVITGPLLILAIVVAVARFDEQLYDF